MNRKLTLLRNLFLSTPILFTALTSNAQFLQTTDAAFNSPYTPQSLITNVFLGTGVDVLNVTYNGNPAAVGYFSGGTQAVGLERGILMTTGYASTPAVGFGPTSPASSFAHNMNLSTAYDANLDTIATAGLRDVAVYTITFVPTADTLRFRYCFASEEYPEWSCTLYNDIFGFFIQGPGYPTPTNIALIPGTNLPVAINNIHPPNILNNAVQPCDNYNIQYYNPTALGSQPVYDARTDVFTAMAVVTPCQQYTITLAIADVQDPGWDSGVFLEAKSFGTTGLRAEVKSVGADGTFAEGCTPASITFHMANSLPQDYPINLNIFGTATPGTDFQALPANVVIPAGQTQATYIIPAFEDNLAEPIEMIGFDFQIDACRRDTVYLYLRDNQIVAPMMRDTTLCTPGASITLNATLPIATTQPPSFSNTQDININANNTTVTSTINVSGLPSTNLGPGVIRSVCLNATHQDDGDLDLFLVSPGGQVLELSTDNGGAGNNYTNTCFLPSATQPVNFPGPQAPPTAAPFTGNFQPEGAWSDLWDTPNRPANGAWKLKATDDFLPYSGTLLDWSITFTPTYEVNYQWAASPDISCPTCPTNIVIPAATTTYSVTATDNYGCSVTDDILVGISNAFATAVIDSPISCGGQNNGSVGVTVVAGGTNTYLWSDPAGQTSAQISNLGVGTYTVTVTNSGGCSATSSVTLSAPPAINLNANVQQINCFGQTSGSISLLVSGGAGPFQYIWNTGATIPTLGSLGAGAYSVTVTDGNSCSSTQSYTINQPAAIQLATTTVEQVSCFNKNDGEIAVTATGGVAPISYLWSSGQTSAAITGLAAGTYTVTITDAQGCTSSMQQLITQPPVLSAFPTSVAARCFGNSDGELHLDIFGGALGYMVSWQGPGSFSASGTDLTGLIAGNYAATITDQSGCTLSTQAVVDEPAAIQLSLPNIADTVCFAATNGTATVVPSGGSGQFTYLWDNNGQTGATANGLSSQLYQVTVTDMNGCSKTAQTIIAQKDQINAFAAATLPTCHNDNDATASVQSVFYGITSANVNAFNYLWNSTPPQQGITATNLQAGLSYTVQISDADGCTADYVVSVGNPEALTATILETGETNCNGEATGWASVGASGGVGPYSYLWAAGTTPNDPKGSGLAAGPNFVTITDANGCNEVLSVTIVEPTPVNLQINASDVKCFGEASGAASVTASGGATPYQINWWNGQQDTNIQGLLAGSYDITVTDANGCRTADNFEIQQPASPVTGTADMKEPRCFGEHNGQITIHPSGGTPPYRYALDDRPLNGSSIQLGLGAGSYTPLIVDALGCTLALPPVEVTQKNDLIVDLGPDIRILLGQDTQLLAQVLNNTGDYQLFWSPEDSTWLSCLDCLNPSVYSLEFSNYFEVSVTDSLGCRSEDQILVSVDKPRKVFVPTAFSPNGDLNNDLLLVHGQKTSKALVFRVYDRWGEMVYEAKNFAFNDENIGWDGTFRGQAMDPGVYVWVLEVEYVDGVTERYKGNTTLIR